MLLLTNDISIFVSFLLSLLHPFMPPPPFYASFLFYSALFSSPVCFLPPFYASSFFFAQPLFSPLLPFMPSPFFFFLALFFPSTFNAFSFFYTFLFSSLSLLTVLLSIIKLDFNCFQLSFIVNLISSY